jgi:CRP/FNR family cyclic AMP-dependent transcriptional regulator
MPRRQTPIRRSFDKRHILETHPIFGALDRQALDRLSAYAVRRTVKRGATIFAKGDSGTTLFAVCSGTVKITAQSPGGREALFNIIREGAIFGEIALLDGQPRTADAAAITDCELMVIERREFESLVYERPEITLKLFEVLCARLRRTTEQLEDLMFLDLQARLAKTLLRFALDPQPSRSGGRVSLTQRNISEIIGISRESVNKQLRVWEKNGWLLLKHGGIEVLASEPLAAIASTISDD